MATRTNKSVPAVEFAVEAPKGFSLDSLTPVKVEAPKRVTPTGRNSRDNSIVEGWLNDLWATRAEGAKVTDGLAIKIPASAYPEMRSRLNQAGAKLNIGVTISPNKKPDVKDDEIIELSFAAKVRKQNKPKETAPVVAPVGTTETPA
jgi:hypothetical protein